MSLLWWQNGRDIDWFSTNLEKWIKPGVVSTHSNNSQIQGGRYSKLKSCRLSKTCQTMMYIPQEQQARDLSYEEQLVRFQDDRPYKYSQRQEHYNSHYNYIRTSARRAYYKPETHEIVLADEYDKIKTIQRQNRAKNYDYLILLQQFLTHQGKKANNKGSEENIGTLTSYLNNNIEQYEQTDQTITLKQFLQEGIQKHEHDHLITLKEFLQESSSSAPNQHTSRNQMVKEEYDLSESKTEKESQKDVALQEFLLEDCEDNILKTFNQTNPFANEVLVKNNRNNPMIAQDYNECNNKDSNDRSIEELSFEEFLKERQNVNCQIGSCQSIVKKNEISPGSPYPKGNCTVGADSNENLSFGEFLEVEERLSCQHSPIIKKTRDISPRKLRSKVTFTTETKSHSIESADKISFDEFLKESKDKICYANQPKIIETNGVAPCSASPYLKKKLGLETEKSAESVDSKDKVTFVDFLKENQDLKSICRASEEDKAMTLKSQPFILVHPDFVKLGKSNEHKAKVKNRNVLKLSKSFNDRTNIIKDNLIKKLTRNELQNENGDRKESTEEYNNKITLYEFLKEEDQKVSSEIEKSLKNLKLRSKHDDNEMFYEINNNVPEIRLNDNIIQVETRTPEMKYNQYEHNKHVCAGDNQIVLTGKVYNQNYTQLSSNNTTGHDKIDFVDNSYDYHRKIRQENTPSSPFQKSNNKLGNSMQTQRRRFKTKTKPYVLPINSALEQGLYQPLWPTVLLTYDKVFSPSKIACSNESYA